MYGVLYVIKNKVNNKVYIGKTYKSIEYRLNEHIKTAYKVESKQYNYKIYQAIRKYGPENFYIESIGQLEEGILEQKEQEYIAKYDSYHNGYNSTLGGDGVKRILKMEELHTEIEGLYTSGKSIKEIAMLLDTSINSVKNVLLKYNVQIKHSTNPKDTRIIQYDIHFNPLKVFESKVDISTWMINETNYSYNQRTLYTAINTACNSGCIRYGHRWQRVLDLIHNEKIFRTKFDKEAYISGKYAYKPDGKNYFIVDEALDEVLSRFKPNGKAGDC